MSIFSQLMGGGSQNSNNTPPAQQPAPRGATHTPTSHLTGGSGTPPGTTPSPRIPGQNPAPQQPQQQQQQQQPEQTQQPQGISLAQLLGQSPEPGGREQNPAEFAQNFIAALQSANPDLMADQSGQPVRLDEQQLFQAFSQVDMTGNIDVNALLEGMQTEEGPQMMRQAFQQTQLNTIMAMAPLMNQLVSAAVERATQTAITTSDHNLTSSAIISAFRDRYSYASNPIVSGMLESLAPQIAQSIPKGTPTAKAAEALHRLFEGISASTTEPRDGPANGPGIQRDFRGLLS